MRHRFLLIFIILLGIFIIPSNAMACEKSGTHTHSTKTIAKKTTKKACCGCHKTNNIATKNTENDDCGGDCDGHCCACHHLIVDITSAYQLHFESELWSETRSNSLRPTEPLMRSSDCNFLWFIPKIG